MFGEEADCLGRGVKKEGRDLADKPRQQRAKLRHDFFEAAGHSFSGRFQTVCYSADHHPNRDPSRKKDGRHSDAIFFEDLLDPLSQRHGCFSFSDLRLQRDLLRFVSQCDL